MHLIYKCTPEIRRAIHMNGNTYTNYRRHKIRDRVVPNKTENESSVENVLTIMKPRTNANHRKCPHCQDKEHMDTRHCVWQILSHICGWIKETCWKYRLHFDYLVMVATLRVGITSSRPSPARNWQYLFIKIGNFTYDSGMLTHVPYGIGQSTSIWVSEQSWCTASRFIRE